MNERIRKMLDDLGFVRAADDIANVCKNCGEAFSNDNVMTDAGWIETQVSGLCEICFDDITDEEYNNLSL